MTEIEQYESYVQALKEIRQSMNVKAIGYGAEFAKKLDEFILWFDKTIGFYRLYMETPKGNPYKQWYYDQYRQRITKLIEKQNDCRTILSMKTVLHLGKEEQQ